VQSLAQKQYVIVPDLRGHGDSDKPKSGYHVSRLAMDLKNLIDHLELPDGQISAIGTSLGAAILWYDLTSSFVLHWLTYALGPMWNSSRRLLSVSSYLWIKRHCRTTRQIGVPSTAIVDATVQKLLLSYSTPWKMIPKLLISGPLPLV
jgi:hypothetical protein